MPPTRLTRSRPRPPLALLLVCLIATSAFGAPARPAALQVAFDRLELLRQAVEEARVHEKADPSKANALATQAALDAYNAAATERAAELKDKMRSLDRTIRKVTGARRTQSAGDTRPSAVVPKDLLAAYDALRTEYERLSSHAVQRTPDFTVESEPNNTPAQATPLDIAAQPCVIASGLISPAGDLDFYSFTAPAGARVWAYVDTGGTPLGTSADSYLTLFAPDGSTVVEADDDDGTGNGCDATTESLEASAIAGRTLPSDGTYYLQVRAFSSADTIDPYQLFLVVSAGAVAPETEPNDTPMTATPVLTPGVAHGERGGALSSASDVDYYSLYASAGTALYVSVDADPERDGGTDVAVDLLTPDGVTVLFTADSSGAATGAAEAFCFYAPMSGPFLARVRSADGVSSGTYTILAASCGGGCNSVACPPPIIHATLGSGSPDYPGVSGQQVGRLGRYGNTTQCDHPTFCPGYFDATGVRLYDAYTFSNCGGSPVCVTATLSTACGGSNYLFAATYLGSFDPNNLCENYLADPGFSPGTSISWSFNVPAGESFVVVVHEVDPGAGCPGYELLLDGLPCQTQSTCSLVCPQDLLVNAQSSSGATVTFPPPATTGNCGPVVCSPASGSLFPVGTTPVSCVDLSTGVTCSFNVTVQMAFDVCCVDDASGDRFDAVATDSTSPLYGYWEYHVAATGQVFCGHAESIAYRPGLSLTMYDRNPADNTASCRSDTLDARIDYARHVCQVRIIDRVTGRSYVLRDRNIDDTTCP